MGGAGSSPGWSSGKENLESAGYWLLSVLQLLSPSLLVSRARWTPETESAGTLHSTLTSQPAQSYSKVSPSLSQSGWT